MKRITVLNYLTLLLLFFCCTSCDSKRTMDNMKNGSLFVWQPALTVPKYYPVQALYARVMVGWVYKPSIVLTKGPSSSYE